MLVCLGEVHKELPKGQNVVRIWGCRMTVVQESGLRMVSWRRTSELDLVEHLEF